MGMDLTDRRSEFGFRCVDEERALDLCKFCDKIRDLDSWCSAIIRKGPYSHEVRHGHHASLDNLRESALLGCELCSAVLDILKTTSPDWQSKEDIKQATNDPRHCQITYSGNLWFDGVIFEQGVSGRQSKRLVLEGFTKKGDPLSSYFCYRQMIDRSDLGACFDLIHQWMRTCKGHNDCTWDEASTLPSRVIDVGPSSGEIAPKLLITNKAKGVWTTLSHCWGDHIPMTTTLATLSDMIEALPLDQLPPTFRDAVVITRELGFRYLWVDALCIIQDSREDWAAESIKMEEIYSKCALNICASAARNSGEGIFEVANSNQHYNKCVAVLPCHSKWLQSTGDVGFRLHHQRAPNIKLSAEALHGRAWVLQESLLSPRRLDFGSSNIFWKCCTSSLSGACPERSYYAQSGEPLSVGNIYDIPTKKLDSYPRVGINTRKDHMNFWYATVQNYLQRSITFHDDILPAIAGVAQKFQHRTGYHYKAGLWMEDFHRGLLWQSDGPVIRAISTNNPSWSWTSTIIPWKVPHRDTATMTEYLPGFRATIVELKITTRNDIPFASIVTSRLRIRGQWQHLNHWRDESAPLYNGINDNKQIWKTAIGLEEYDTDIPTGRVICTMDDRSDPKTWMSNSQEKGFICFQVARFRRIRFNFSDIQPSTIYALILEPTHRTADEYRRVGIAEIPENNGMATGWDTKIISIV